MLNCPALNMSRLPDLGWDIVDQEGRVDGEARKLSRLARGLDLGLSV